ncbi:MAG: FecR domain-containing protein [Minisyncoccia bacterium]
MNKTNIFIVLVVATLVLGGVFLNSFGLGKKEIEKDSSGIVEKGGWIEVLSASVFLVENKNGVETKKILSTGDSISEGEMLETDSEGKAAIHLFDGSVLRVNSGTKFILNTAEYNKDSGKLMVKASLSSGRIWSKIIELATPDSIWQVETSNTVATVRGSAFGVSTDGKTSEVLVSQHKVSVEVVDPKTKEKIKVQPVVVNEGISLKISNDDIEKVKEIEKRASAASPSEREAILKTTELVFVPAKIGEKTKAEEWFKGNEDEDKKVEEKVKKVREEAGADKNAFRKILNKEAKKKLHEAKSKKDNAVNNENEDQNEKPIEMKAEEVQKQITPVAPVKWDHLKIETKSLISDLTEEDKVVFRAVLYGAGGATRDVTSEATWEVSGQMGVMTLDGIFTAKLDPLISELGEGSGTVRATWKDADGALMHAESGLIHVVPKIDNTVENG